MSESHETTPSGREHLLILESAGKNLFHGTASSEIESFEPRQAYYHNDDGTKDPDGAPAVFASDRADYAILMALINEKNCPDGFESSAETVDGEGGEIVLVLKVKKSALTQLTDKAFGYVYVFNREHFKKKTTSRTEFISTKPVNSVEKIKVTKADLPPYIEVFE